MLVPLKGEPVSLPMVGTEIRVRYAETDAMGIAHHTAYLVWFEVGRTEYTRAAGLPYRQVEAEGTRLVVVESHCRYHQPARYDDLLVVKTTVRELTRAKLTFGYEVWRHRDNELLAEGYTVHVATDVTGRVRKIPESVRALAEPGRKTPA